MEELIIELNDVVHLVDLLGGVDYEAKKGMTCTADMAHKVNFTN